MATILSPKNLFFAESYRILCSLFLLGLLLCVSITVTGEEIFDMNALLQIFSYITGRSSKCRVLGLVPWLTAENGDSWSKRVYLSPLVIYFYLFDSGSCILQQCLLNVESAWFSEFFTSYERLKKVACENVSCAMPCE